MSIYDNMSKKELKEEIARQKEEARKDMADLIKNMTPEEKEKYDRHMEDDHLFLKMNSGIGPEGGGPSPLLEKMSKKTEKSTT